ncbi:uncharacterized protein MONBRDRAFT_25289 [Monosiga brevicollis MX1]|uniref:Bromo domain-containing protein n=1 Tax=Monosiga brevicollis TaxID=81824 RepID=A9UYZ0_MONBE|nr:uncharacterized protein MONBRDRAFT_25289 [Monosiga brevicollis MX1]EDQ89692.1 predicted protein [Monosiga brevicollis MX1]|eukprot:XP_001745721.1 hypothetical protein [Monosiga brevicollis MX1]
MDTGSDPALRGAAASSAETTASGGKPPNWSIRDQLLLVEAVLAQKGATDWTKVSHEAMLLSKDVRAPEFFQPPHCKAQYQKLLSLASKLLTASHASIDQSVSVLHKALQRKRLQELDTAVSHDLNTYKQLAADLLMLESSLRGQQISPNLVERAKVLVKVAEDENATAFSRRQSIKNRRDVVENALRGRNSQEGTRASTSTSNSPQTPRPVTDPVGTTDARTPPEAATPPPAPASTGRGRGKGKGRGKGGKGKGKGKGRGQGRQSIEAPSTPDSPVSSTPNARESRRATAAAEAEKQASKDLEPDSNNEQVQEKEHKASQPGASNKQDARESKDKAPGDGTAASSTNVEGSEQANEANESTESAKSPDQGSKSVPHKDRKATRSSSTAASDEEEKDVLVVENPSDGKHPLAQSVTVVKSEAKTEPHKDKDKTASQAVKQETAESDGEAADEAVTDAAAAHDKVDSTPGPRRGSRSSRGATRASTGRGRPSKSRIKAEDEDRATSDDQSEKEGDEKEEKTDQASKAEAVDNEDREEDEGSEEEVATPVRSGRRGGRTPARGRGRKTRASLKASPGASTVVEETVSDAESTSSRTRRGSARRDVEDESAASSRMHSPYASAVPESVLTAMKIRSSHIEDFCPITEDFEDDWELEDDPDERERRQKSWRASIMQAWTQIAGHKDANLFRHPVKEEHAPDYHKKIKEPMDLGTIKHRVESGAIKTTRDFERAMNLMFTNACVYNDPDHFVHIAALEMAQDARNAVASYRNTILAMRQGEGDQETRGTARRKTPASSRKRAAVVTKEPESASKRPKRRGR